MATARLAFIFLIFAAGFAVLGLSEDLPITSLEVGSQTQLSIKGNETAYYKFRVDKIEPKYDLSIVANPRGDNDPDIFLSTKEKYPNNKDNSEYFSTSYGYSSIYIPEAEIKVGTDYYLGVTCSSLSCDLNLTIDYAQEYYMRPFVETATIEYLDGGSVVARVSVPEQSSATHIVFSAEMENLVETEGSLHMYVNIGNEIPTSFKYDLIALVAWKDGKAATIYKDDPKFCTNCNYTIVLEAPKKSVIVLRRTIYGDKMALDLNSERNDAVDFGSNVTYAVNISKFDPVLSFVLVEVTPYFGLTQVFANVETLPDKFGDYKYNMTGFGQEILFVPVQLVPANGLLYVTINGITFSTFTIRVYTMDKKNTLLKLGEPEVAYILDKELENFLVVANGRKEMKVSFSLHPEQGKVNLFVKSCAKKTECSFTQDEVQGVLNGTIQTSKKKPILQFSNVTDGDQSIEVQMDGSTCDASSSKGAPKCYFAIGVLGLQDGTSKFTLTATRAGLHHALRAGHTVRGHVKVDQYKYYSFTIGNDTGVESVNFQITKVSGIVDVYISRQAKYPDFKDKEKLHHYNDLYSFEKSNFSDLSGTYYIAIKGFSSATYSILPIVKYNVDADNLGGHHLVKLVEGIPQKITLDNDPAYFKFEAFFTDEQNQGIEITLDEVQGSFVICARNDALIPQVGNCQFTSNTSTLYIPKDDPNYQGIGTYFVGVFPQADEGSSSKSRAQSFSISWSAFHTFRVMSFGFSLTNYISSSRPLFYKFEVHPTEDKEIIIHKSSFSASAAQIDMSLANVETKLGHNVSVFNPDRTSNGTDSLKLNEADIIELCKESKTHSDDNKCYLYLGVTTTSEEEIAFTLSLNKDFDDLRLSEGIQGFYSFPGKGHPLHLYYYPHRLEDVTIMAHSFGRNITLYANIVNTREHSSRREWTFPSEKNYELTAQGSISHKGESRLDIPASSLSVCGVDYEKFRCGIALTLYYESAPNTPEIPGAAHYKDFSLFSILATQEITPIAAGKPIQTSVNKNTYKYFSLFVNKEQATLLISASVLSGKHVAILASKGKDARPTLSDAEFKSYFGKMETLQISGEETLQGTAKGYWVIAVYGYSSAEFVLNVVYEKSKMVELHRGLPVNVDIEKDPVFFEYYHEVGSSFQFKMTKERGSGVVSVRAYREGDDIASNLPTETSGDIIRTFEDVQTIISLSNATKDFCSGCLYVVGVFPKTEMKVSLVTLLPGEFIYLQDNMIFTDYAAHLHHNSYEHFAISSQSIDINMVVYSGEPRIYVSHNPTVNESNYIWSFTEISPNNYIRMRLDNSKYVTSPPEPVWDGTKNVSSSTSVYYVMVVAPTYSNYSIAVSVSNSTRHLIDGHLDFGFLNSGEFNLYKYHVSKDTESVNNRLKLQFTLHRDKFFDALKEEFTQPNIIVMAVPKNSSNKAPIDERLTWPDLPVLTPIRQDVLEKSFGDQHYTINVQYQAEAGQDFYIVVDNTQAKVHLNYSIVANSHEPLLLTMNNMHASRVAVGDSDIYSVHASHPGLLVIEIHECMGKVMVQTSNSRQVLLASKPLEAISDDGSTVTNVDDGQSPKLNLIPSSMGSHISLASLTLDEEQTVYIQITAIDGERDDDTIPDIDAVYKVRVNLYPLRNFLPFMNLEPGDEGQLDWDVPNPGTLKVGFDEVHNLAVLNKAIKSTKFGNLDIQYHYELILTKDPDAANYLSRCDMLPKSEGVFKGMDRYQKTIAIDRSQINQDLKDEAHKYVEVSTDANTTDLYATLRVTAIGVDAKGNAVWDYPIIYKTTEIKTVSTGAQRFIIILLVVCVLMLVCAVGGLLYYYKKFQRVKAKLNYEMQDLRNIASTVESFEMLDESNEHKAGYTGLIENKL